MCKVYNASGLQSNALHINDRLATNHVRFCKTGQDSQLVHRMDPDIINHSLQNEMSTEQATKCNII